MHLLFLLACGARSPVAEPVATPAVPSAPERRILVDEWLFTPGSAAWSQLPKDWAGSALSPSGALLLRVRSDEAVPRASETLEIMPTGGEGPGTRFEVPAFLDRSDAPDAEKGELYTRSWAAWLDEQHVLVVQGSYQALLDCRVLRLADLRFVVPPAGCPESDFAELYAADPGPGGLLALYSAGEGHPGVNVVRYTGDRQEPLPMPDLDLYPSGPLAVRFGPTDDVVTLQTPCDLGIERGCMAVSDSDEALPERLFRWRASEPTVLEELRSDLPPDSVYDPVSGSWAWVDEGRGCHARGGAPDPVCVDLPSGGAD